jgi:hypothetical protein
MNKGRPVAEVAQELLGPDGQGLAEALGQAARAREAEPPEPVASPQAGKASSAD